MKRIFYLNSADGPNIRVRPMNAQCAAACSAWLLLGVAWRDAANTAQGRPTALPRRGA
jgi:hypothetical protein